ncbi:uncharacterized protein LOC127790902 [Diospyros lotus]|uniref:uncharacterized protein LOC127790902 n=1 Tax=Diospyros lotus TaxID=55363 RepID=UPI00225A4A4B|nr:uncharacterized protein LOC127790902 [Diospyros lotus]
MESIDNSTNSKGKNVRKSRGSSHTDDGGEGSRSRRSWRINEERALLNLLKELSQDPKFKQDNQWKGGYLAELQVRLKAIFPNTDLKAVPHITSKMDTWKRFYNCLQTLMNNTGFGWNDRLKMIECDSEEVWAEFEKKDKYVKYVRDKSMPYYDDWVEIWGKDRATGEYAQSPAEILQDLNNHQEQQPREDEVNNLEEQGEEAASTETIPNSSKSGSKKKRRMRADNSSNELSIVSDSINKLSETMEKSLCSIGDKLGKRSLQREELAKFLDAVPFANINERFMVASEIGRKPELLDHFCIIAPAGGLI